MVGKYLNDHKETCKEFMYLYCDNKSINNISHNLVQHNMIKQIEIINWHFTKEKLDIGLITTFYVLSGTQLVDLFTKGLPIEWFHDLKYKRKMIDIYSPAWKWVLLVRY